MIKNYSPTQRCGFKAERMAGEFLKKKGFEILCSNFYTRFGEIDLIVEDAKTLIFVEVRYRQQQTLITPAESVDKKKQRKIIKSAINYLHQNPTHKHCRFDVIAIQPKEGGNEINWIKDAFQVQ